MLKQILKIKYNTLKSNDISNLLKKEKTTPENIPESIFKDVSEEERRPYT